MRLAVSSRRLRSLQDHPIDRDFRQAGLQRVNVAPQPISMSSQCAPMQSTWQLRRKLPWGGQHHARTRSISATHDPSHGRVGAAGGGASHRGGLLRFGISRPTVSGWYASSRSSRDSRRALPCGRR